MSIVLGLVNNSKFSIIGFDMGGVVATGFAAKFPTLCESLVLLSPLGIDFVKVKYEGKLQQSYVGEYYMWMSKYDLVAAQEKEFHDISSEAAHRVAIDKQTAMVKWQIDHTPGYLGALLSTYRKFPMRGIEELYSAVGHHSRSVMIIWGEKDKICEYRECVKQMEKCFPYSCIVDIKDCGHNTIAERFDEVTTELLCFHRTLFAGDNRILL